MDDRHIGPDRRHGGELFSRVRAGDAADVGVHLRQVDPDIAAKNRKRQAGGAGLPFAVFRGYVGVDLPKVNPNIRSVTCPYTGEKLATVPAIRPDVAIIHALRADRAGNVLLEGIVGVQKQAVLAARRSIVTVEEVVDDFGARSPNAVILPSWTISAIVVST